MRVPVLVRKGGGRAQGVCAILIGKQGNMLNLDMLHMGEPLVPHVDNYQLASQQADYTLYSVSADLQ